MSSDLELGLIGTTNSLGFIVDKGGASAPAERRTTTTLGEKVMACVLIAPTVTLRLDCGHGAADPRWRLS